MNFQPFTVIQTCPFLRRVGKSLKIHIFKPIPKVFGIAKEYNCPSLDLIIAKLPTMNQKYFIVFILIITSLKLNAQTSSFDVSVDYFSNTSTFGQVNLLEKQPSSSIALNYTLKNSLNAGLSTAYIGNSDTSLSTGTF